MIVSALNYESNIKMSTIFTSTTPFLKKLVLCVLYVFVPKDVKNKGMNKKTTRGDFFHIISNVSVEVLSIK